ncbi:Serine proteinase stubble [Orchesella cincta]|uniref:Serine proteinase stubble n=1 Tax=Orchesella cincta TaxID=48709 RepID=A0A1D2MG72_ORCCI|nr:Serine proteinase stubble [Orchesella cincta]
MSKSNSHQTTDENAQQQHELQGTSRQRFIWGDSAQCYSGSCEFFLFCWLGGGLIEKGCGGFLFACCQRQTTPSVKSGIGNSPTEPPAVPEFYGPVTNDPRCGLAADNLWAQERIVGGREAGFGTFPWQVYIRIGSSRCGGSLINDRHVVTAGHCVAKASPYQIAVTLGDYVLNSNTEPYPPVTVGVSQIKVHPHFKFTPQADRYDVAVLRLDRKVSYLPHIRPICLPDKGADFTGQYAWASGWGAVEAGSRLRPKTLQAVDVPVIESRDCEVWHRGKGINVVIYDEMICAGYQFGGKDSCQGDSGGPLMLQKGGRWYLIGIVSAGYSCAQRQQPGIYHRVAYTSDWVSYAANGN